jgi:hypothetical protein
MPNTFDRYREALVVETKTIWPDELPNSLLKKGTGSEPTSENCAKNDGSEVPVPLIQHERRRIEERLHAEPAQAAELEYVRLHVGFIRQITVMAADLERLGIPA